MATTQPVMTIDQATLSAGTAGESRADLVPNQLVTVTASATSSYSNDTNRYALQIIGVEPTSDTAPTVTVATNRTFTFTPPASSYGRTYRLKLTVDGGTAFERTVIRTASVRTEHQAWRLPAPNERASTAATLQNMGSDQVALSETNAGASPWGWHEGATEILRSLDTVVGWVGINAAISSSSAAAFSYVYLDAGTWTFDAIADKDASGATFTAELYDVTGTAVSATATYNAASTAVAMVSAAASFTVTTPGLWAIRAATSTGNATLYTVRLRRA